MKQDKIFAAVKKPNGNYEIRLLEKEPKSFNAIIEGKREIIPFPGILGVCIIFDGEAIANQRKPGFFLPEYNDLILGAAVFAGVDFETGFISLTEEQAVRIEEYLETNNAGKFVGDAGERTASGYLPLTEENYLYGLLSEVKTKYKTLKFKWMQKR